MVRVIPFGKLQKLWATGWGHAYFLFFLVSSADLARFGFSNRMVCVNGKPPRTPGQKDRGSRDPSDHSRALLSKNQQYCRTSSGENRNKKFRGPNAPKTLLLGP